MMTDKKWLLHERHGRPALLNLETGSRIYMEPPAGNRESWTFYLCAPSVKPVPLAEVEDEPQARALIQRLAEWLNAYAI